MKKYIAWVDYGCEGWHMTEFDTLEECIKQESYGQNKIITKRVEFDITERE